MKVFLEDAARQCGIEPEILLRFIAFTWVRPLDPDEPMFDEEDIARARLIAELQREFGVNDAAVPVILQLIDQLHWLRRPR
jgi:chaperone modulatory protein CbpM